MFRQGSGLVVLCKVVRVVATLEVVAGSLPGVVLGGRASSRPQVERVTVRVILGHSLETRSIKKFY